MTAKSKSNSGREIYFDGAAWRYTETNALYIPEEVREDDKVERHHRSELCS